MLAPLVAYDATGLIIASLSWMVRRDPEGRPTGVVDFAAAERAGLPLLDIWNVPGAVGSGTWPEWLASRAHDFTVELEPGWSRMDPERGPHRIRALVHRATGARRDREELVAAIGRRVQTASGPVDLRDLLGGPEAPLLLDADGNTLGRSPRLRGSPTHLPGVGLGHRP